MPTTAEEILEQIRALPPRERLKVAERVVHEAAEGDGGEAGTGGRPYWENLSDEEHEGQTTAKIAALLTVLEARGLVPSTNQRRRVEQCTELGLLDRLIRAAATADSLRKVFYD